MNAITRVKPKVALLIPNLTGGGAERVMVILANEFSNTHCDVDLVIVNDDDMHYSSELSGKVNLVNLHKKRAIGSISSIRRYLRAAKPDALITTLNHVTAAAALALSISGKLPTKFYPREDRAPKKYSIREPYMLFLSHIVKWAYNKADGIISLSDDMANQLRQHYRLRTPIHTIYNPVYFNDILTKAEEEIKPALPWDSGNKFVLGVGRLTTQKDFKTLIHAIAIVKTSHNINLVLLGDGPERESLITLATELNIQDSLYMPGFVDNPFAYMKFADIFVLSSILEGLPNALIQALVCGTTCIATNCPTGPREVLQDGQFGSLVDVGDYESIAQNIIDHLDGRKNKPPSITLLKEKYEANRIAKLYLQVILNKQ